MNKNLDTIKKNILVIGGGASGMAAAYAASLGGHHVILFEKNEKLGKKIYITGKGRCNCTNASDIETILKNVVTNRKFLYSAFYTFTNEDLCAFLEAHGCPVKTERGNRVFPVSDHSSDVTRAWERALLENHVDIRYHSKVEGLISEEIYSDEHLSGGKTIRRVVGVRVNGRAVYGDHVILATGGLSYPSTGSDGDGYRFAEAEGHRLIKPVPSLVSFKTKEGFVRELSGLSLKNIGISVLETGENPKKKPIFTDFGEMLFTHDGVSGPVILSASSWLARTVSDGKELQLLIDLKPALSVEQLDERILRDFSEVLNRQFKNALDGLLPKSLIPVVISLSKIPEDRAVNSITKEERLRLVSLMKGLPLTVVGTGGFIEAVITQGGVSVQDIDSSTMKSKQVIGLSFAGELIDVDALTGGFNLQIAWSTGYLAGLSV